MEDLKFKWDASVEFDNARFEGIEGSTEQSLIISGELVNASKCANNFALDESELPKLVDQLKNATLRVDHGKSVRDVIGGFRGGSFDFKNKRVMFEAEVDDPLIQRSIMKGRLKYISIGATADAYCSGCGKSTKPFKQCKCKNSHEIIKNIRLKEASIVTEPAYKDAEFMPVGFIASITSALSETGVTVTPASNEVEARPSQENKILEEKRKMSTENKVEATTLKPAGADAVVVLGEKLEKLVASVAKMEERFKKIDEDESKKKNEDEAKKKDDEVKKKDDAFITTLKEQFATLSTKLDAFKPKVKEEGGIPKDVGKSKFEEKKEPPAPEEEPEEKTKKEIVKAGTKVEPASETQSEITADAIPPWYKEITAFAKANRILD